MCHGQRRAPGYGAKGRNYEQIGIGGVPSLAPSQALTKCIAGQEVTDKEGKTGVVVSDDGKLCQVKYADGQT